MSRSLCLVVLALLLVASPSAQAPLDREAARWVETTLKGLSLDELAGQLVFGRLDATFLATDSDAYDELVRLVHEAHLGGVTAFGGTEPAPRVLLNDTYGPVILGQPLAIASTLNRLQAVARVPLLTSADFEWGAGMRIHGATKFPRAMAFGAAGDAGLAEEAGRLTAIEGRAMGVHVNFAPVADVNNNPRNPVINIRAFGEDPARVGTLVGAWVRGLQGGGMDATLKHFPGHGDTDVDSHLGLPVIPHPRARIEQVELPPFRAGIAAEAHGVMVAHIELPEIDKAVGPATFSRPVVTDLLRGELGFGGLIYSDSMRMDAITAMVEPGEAAVRAVAAGIDVVLDSPDPVAATRAIRAALDAGRLTRAQVEASARRILTAKARLGLHRTRTVNIEAVPLHVGGRTHEAVARAVAEKALTLVKDERTAVPLAVPRGGSVLYLSVLDYPSNWRTASPSRTMIPALRERWPDLESVELSDRTTPGELALVRAMASRYDAVVAGVFVRAASASGRLDLAPQVARLLEDVARITARRGTPMAAVFFGNPYASMSVPSLPAVLLAYDFSDHAELAAVRALAGETAIGGTLPVALPGLFPVGHGLTRPGLGQP
ncbi:MAG: glycoside hydrolase family 3 protein [Vicinamibacterales bacterium]|nr:glycoside hydrolase family 3 protein [Vicinamibacterales bacterium]